eukprot:scaffold675529_cov114-Prasinocladus_malaysianus.AAC.1
MHVRRSQTRFSQASPCRIVIRLELCACEPGTAQSSMRSSHSRAETTFMQKDVKAASCSFVQPSGRELALSTPFFVFAGHGVVCPTFHASAKHIHATHVIAEGGLKHHKDVKASGGHYTVPIMAGLTCM